MMVGSQESDVHPSGLMDASHFLAQIHHLWHDWLMISSAIPLLILGITGELPTPDELLAKATAALGGEAALSTNLQTAWTVTKSTPNANSPTSSTTKEEVTAKVTNTSYELKVKQGKGHLTLFHTAKFDWMQLPRHTNIPAVRISQDRLHQWDPIAQPHLEFLAAWNRRPERRTMGLVMRGDEACYRIRLAGSSDPTFLEEGAEFVYLSVITGLPVTHESAASSRSGARRITDFQNWESVGTIKLPKQLTLTGINGTVRLAQRTSASILEAPLVLEVPQNVKDAKDPNPVVIPDEPSLATETPASSEPTQPKAIEPDPTVKPLDPQHITPENPANLP